ncbi:MAG: 3-hydroxyacyl-ACP dehydratase FabZ family protein [Planctomycetota bacterium]|nr:3-hydroxyacyl-ACP dehydratase FabZ family protein [Planctomycetota bacterium]
MANKNFLVDLEPIDFDQPIAEVDEIRDYNLQRHEMEQLSAIVYENLEEKSCVGYLDVTDHEFWVRGHMPNLPLMPGVIMLEAVAQMCSYFVQKNNLLDSAIVGFGGVEKVRFREPVVPGQRLVLIGKLTKIRPKWMIVCEFQGVVGQKIVVDGSIKGIPLPVDQLNSIQNSGPVTTATNPTNLAAN